MIGLFTDFGPNGPYLGQMQAVLRLSAPNVDIIDLINNAPCSDPWLSGYLLAAVQRDFPGDSVILCVVDPGVGGSRLPIVLHADGKWFVGPDNGLLNGVAIQSKTIQWYRIVWKPEKLSKSFHGRDLFAPIAARLTAGKVSDEIECYCGPDLRDWPADLDAIVYFDHYGNAITGRRYSTALDSKTIFLADGERIPQALTFCEVEVGRTFWYCNSSGQVELAVNKGRAEQILGLSLGDGFSFESLASSC